MPLRLRRFNFCRNFFLDNFDNFFPLFVFEEIELAEEEESLLGGDGGSLFVVGWNDVAGDAFASFDTEAEGTIVGFDVT